VKSIRSRSAALLPVLAALVVVAGACASSAPKAAPPTTAVPPKVSITPSPANGAKGVALNAPLALTVRNGTIKSVVVRSAAGAGPAGKLSTTGNAWVAPGNFVPYTAYAAEATITDTRGHEVTRRWHFVTGAPAKALHTTLNVGDGGVYGVGMPIIVDLNSPVSADRHAALEKRLTVTAPPGVVGGWHWVTDSELHWRPQVFWPAHSKVSLKIDFAGFDAGQGVWGVDGRTVNFAIGDSHISIVDVNSHTMTVTQNGAAIRTIPVSTGRDQYPTKGGIHVVNEKSQSVVMDSATVGIPRNSPDGYYETVLWDVRISNSGEFVHAAPWSTGAQGNSNVSHGCVNVSTADAEWFYNFTNTGDVVQVNNSPVQLDPWNGYGDWQLPWSQWTTT